MVSFGIYHFLHHSTTFFINSFYGWKFKQVLIFAFKSHAGDLSGGLVIKTLHFQCRGHGFHPWLRN